MTWTISAFAVFTICLLAIVVHYCYFSRPAQNTRRYLNEKRRKQTTVPFEHIVVPGSPSKVPDVPPPSGDGDEDGDDDGGEIDVSPHATDDKESRNDKDHGGKDKDDGKDGDGDKKDDDGKDDAEIPHPDYSNPIARIEPLLEEPTRLREYRLMTDYAANGECAQGTGLYGTWWRDERAFAGMFEFQHEVLRFVATDSNNGIPSIDAYVRCVAVLRDFAQRFASTGGTRIRDWRMYVTMSAAHFAQCMYFVRDASVRDVARRCVSLLVRDPYSVGGKTPEDVDPVTAYRLANTWILANKADGAAD